MRFLLILLLATGIASAADLPLPPQTNTDRGVTVTVTPVTFDVSADVWEFKVVFDTHSQDLRDDLLDNAALIDGSGTARRPSAWEGPAPGGHHREGTLRFDAIKPSPAVLELRITRADEVAPRVFRWDVR